MWSEVDESRRKGGGAPSGDEKEDAGPGLLTVAIGYVRLTNNICSKLARKVNIYN